MSAKTSAIIPSTYAPLLADLKARVRGAQVVGRHQHCRLLHELLRHHASLA